MGKLQFEAFVFKQSVYSQVAMLSGRTWIYLSSLPHDWLQYFMQLRACFGQAINHPIS